MALESMCCEMSAVNAHVLRGGGGGGGMNEWVHSHLFQHFYIMN